MLGVFLPGSEKMLDLRLLWVLLGVAGVFAVSLRLPRAVGIPVGFVLIIGSLLFVLAARSWVPFDRNQPLASFSVLSRNESELRVEVRYHDKRVFGAIPGSQVAATLEVVFIEPPWFFYPDGLVSIGLSGLADTSSQGEIMLAAVDESSHRGLTGLAASIVTRLPGIDRTAIVSKTITPRELYRYTVSIDESDAVLLSPAITNE